MLAAAERIVLDNSKLFAPSPVNMRVGLGALPEARASLACYAGGARVAPHVHEKPYLSLYLFGAYRETSQTGETALGGPSAALHWPGCVHEDAVGDQGLASVVVEFEPHWLERSIETRCAPGASRYWAGGALAGASAILARRWLEGSESETSLLDATSLFMREALATAADPQPPRWIDKVELALAARPEATTTEVSEMLGMHPAWLARAYRRCRGEGLRDSLRRRRVAAAAALLGGTRLPLAQVAQEAGFCDQPHMNRAFRAVLGITPLALRRGRLGLGQGGAAADA
jgi:AraC family transcriptional regulator